MASKLCGASCIPRMASRESPGHALLVRPRGRVVSRHSDACGTLAACTNRLLAGCYVDVGGFEALGAFPFVVVSRPILTHGPPFRTSQTRGAQEDAPGSSGSGASQVPMASVSGGSKSGRASTEDHKIPWEERFGACV